MNKSRQTLTRSSEPRPFTAHNKLVGVKAARSPTGAGSPSKRFKPNFTVQSAQEDVIDQIYTNKDPISVSMKSRLEAGSILSVNKKNKTQAFFFEMKLNGKGKTKKEFKQEAEVKSPA